MHVDLKALFNLPYLHLETPEEWEVRRLPQSRTAVSCCPVDELILGDDDQIRHFVTIAETSTSHDSWVDRVSKIMKPRLGFGSLELEVRCLAGKRCLWAEWTDGVASMESWFTEPSATGAVIEVCAGVLGSWDFAPRADEVRRVLASVRFDS